MKKIKLTLGIILSIMLAGVAFADSPPSLNPQDTPPSLDGVQGGGTPPVDNSTPPSLNGVTQTPQTPTNPTPDTPTNPTPTTPDNKGNTKQTPTNPTPNTPTNPTQPTKKTTNGTTPKTGGLTKTGPELLYLLIPSLVGGYAMRKRK